MSFYTKVLLNEADDLVIKILYRQKISLTLSKVHLNSIISNLYDRKRWQIELKV